MVWWKFSGQKNFFTIENIYCTQISISMVYYSQYITSKYSEKRCQKIVISSSWVLHKFVIVCLLVISTILMTPFHKDMICLSKSWLRGGGGQRISIWILIDHTCLLNCMIPRVGNTQVQEAGKISPSAKLNHCRICAFSRSLAPRSCALATANVRVQ